MDSRDLETDLAPAAPAPAPAAAGTPADPAPPAAEPAEPTGRGYFNDAQVAEIGLARTILPQAQRAEILAALQKFEITPAFLESLQGLVTESSNRMVRTAGSREEKSDDTTQAGQALRALVAAMKDIQSAAKQRANMARSLGETFSTDGYLLGQDLASNREVALLNAAALRQKALDDALPGYDAEGLKTFDALKSAYELTRDEQTTGQEQSGLTRLGRDTLISRLTGARRAVQHAADRAFPHEIEANAPIRRTFSLPPDRRMKE